MQSILPVLKKSAHSTILARKKGQKILGILPIARWLLPGSVGPVCLEQESIGFFDVFLLEFGW
jgi:hypothetical protein